MLHQVTYYKRWNNRRPNLLRLQCKERAGGQLKTQRPNRNEWKGFDNYTFSEGSGSDDTGRCGRGDSSRFGGMERTGAGGDGTGKCDAIGNVITVV